MYSKKKNLIFAGIVVMMVVGILIAYIVSKKQNDIANDANTESNANGEVSIVDEEYQKMNEEANEILKDAAFHPLKIKGGYKDRYDSREINSEFISNELEFIDPISYIRVTFTGYEELNNISEYIGTEGDFATKYYLPEGLNSDGTFYDVTDVIKVRYGDLDYGEVVSTEETRFVGIKLKFTLENLKNEKNKVIYQEFLKTDNFVFLDDGKLYSETTVFSNGYIYGGEPTYISWYERIDHTENGPVLLCNLEPKEKLKCECIFLQYKDHFDSTYLVVTPGSADIENFKNTLTKLIPFSTLKILEEK